MRRSWAEHMRECAYAGRRHHRRMPARPSIPFNLTPRVAALRANFFVRVCPVWLAVSVYTKETGFRAPQKTMAKSSSTAPDPAEIAPGANLNDPWPAPAPAPIVGAQFEAEDTWMT